MCPLWWLQLDGGYANVTVTACQLSLRVIVTIILRPYQIKALDDVRAAYRSGKRAPLLVSPTGSGKTVMFSSVANGVKQRGKRVIILCHRSELIEQIDRALRDVGLVPGIISADDTDTPPGAHAAARSHHLR